MHPKTIKVKAWGPEQGDHVVVNESDFDPKVHELLDGEVAIERNAPSRIDLDQALATLPGTNTDPEYVVRSMRSYFGELFTDADEALVRDVVVSPDKKPSDGLKVDELKAALEAKGIEIPAGALKADLVALLDAAPQG